MAKKMKGSGLYQDRGAMGKLPMHRKMGDMFPHSAPTQESDWLRYRGTAMDEMKSGNFDGAGVKQKGTGHSDWTSMGKFKHPKGGTVEGFQHSGGATKYTINKGGYFTDVKKSDFDLAKESTKYERYKSEKPAEKKIN
jgi:hypothetical protein